MVAIKLLWTSVEFRASYGLLEKERLISNSVSVRKPCWSKHPIELVHFLVDNRLNSELQ